MVKNFNFETKSIENTNIEALELSKSILSKSVEITPLVVGKFLVLFSYPDIEVFIHTDDGNDDPFNNEDEYEENIYYILYETGDVVRVTNDELDRLIKVYIKDEIERGIYISENEQVEYLKLID